MSVTYPNGALQTSLWDLATSPGPGPLGATVARTTLGGGAWLDARPGWIGGADALFSRLVDTVPWRAEERVMYDRLVAVPRLLCFYDEGDPLPDRVLEEAKAILDQHYAAELGEPFATAGLCLYRDGRDSVAWHGDRIGRSRTEDTMVAIISVGAPRPLLLRPRGGGPTVVRRDIGHGDLVVMGGSCQRTWEHAIPKTARSVGPRISIQFRTQGVR
ncbi:MAG: alpha-ketoglutarate-dependent dioxygenase AlkB [Actinomycetota bacterium]|nr:alpha-ketoglutarate-dependent dioxygenase AlkB [Actinomycetota bacterium]